MHICRYAAKKIHAYMHTCMQCTTSLMHAQWYIQRGGGAGDSPRGRLRYIKNRNYLLSKMLCQKRNSEKFQVVSLRY